MRLSKGPRWRFFLRSVPLAILLVCGGCQTPDLFTASGPGWKVEQGQALWRPGHGYPELGGDLVVARNDEGRCVLQFAKTPMALMTGQVTSTDWLIRFPPRRLSFSGRQPPPTRFAWLYLPVALSGGRLPEFFRFERKVDGGWKLENTHSGESLEGFLGP